jgi:hypothetical protein
MTGIFSRQRGEVAVGSERRKSENEAIEPGETRVEAAGFRIVPGASGATRGLAPGGNQCQLVTAEAEVARSNRAGCSHDLRTDLADPHSCEENTHRHRST